MKGADFVQGQEVPPTLAVYKESEVALLKFFTHDIKNGSWKYPVLRTLGLSRDRVCWTDRRT
jgi:hypothetical protein